MAKTVVFDKVGGPDVLRVEDIPVGEPAAEEVRIRVEAIGVNRAEALYRAGQYFYQPSFPGAGIGYEAAGVVEVVGSEVTGFAPGDLVNTVPAFLMNAYATYAEQTIVPAKALVRRAFGLDAVTSAGVWMAYTTAYGMLVELAHVRPGDTVVVNAASSGVGIAAIQIANHLGAIPVAVTRTPAKRDALLAAGAAAVIASAEQDVAEEVRALTAGRGAAVFLDAVGGDGVHTSVSAVEPGGTLILYGFLDPAPIPLPLAADLRGRTIRWYSFFELTTDHPEQLRRAERFINAGLRTGAFLPVIDQIFDLEDVVKAHERLESNDQTGKIVLLNQAFTTQQ